MECINKFSRQTLQLTFRLQIWSFTFLKSLLKVILYAASKYTTGRPSYKKDEDGFDLMWSPTKCYGTVVNHTRELPFVKKINYCPK